MQEHFINYILAGKLYSRLSFYPEKEAQWLKDNGAIIQSVVRG